MRKTAAQLANMVLAKGSRPLQDDDELPEYRPEDRMHRAPLYGGLGGAAYGGLLGAGGGLFGRSLQNLFNRSTQGYGRAALRGGAVGSAIGALAGTGLGAMIQHHNNKAIGEHTGLSPRELDMLDHLYKNPEMFRNEEGELPTSLMASFHDVEGSTERRPELDVLRYR